MFLAVQIPQYLPCEQRFLSCMAFSVYKVVPCVLSVAQLVCLRPVRNLCGRPPVILCCDVVMFVVQLCCMFALIMNGFSMIVLV